MGTMTERLAEIAGGLVGFPSVAADGEALHACADWVSARMARTPSLRVRRFEDVGTPSVLVTVGESVPTVLFCGHLDVVEATDPAAYTGTRQGNRLIGRGAADMKGPIAALLDIVETEPVAGLGLLLTGDEESGGAHGTAHVLRSLDWRPEVVVLPDGGANMRLVTEQKGMLRLRLTAEGQAAHGARPWLGINALERIIAGYQAVRRAYPPPVDEDDWRVSATLTVLRNRGNAPNTVPDFAEGMLDLRYPGNGPGASDGQELLRAVRGHLARHDVRSDILLHAPPFVLDPDSPWAGRLRDVARGVLDDPMRLVREAGASDARYFGVEGVPVLVFQPVCADWHGAGEWIDLESLAAFREVCARFAREALA
ncbi:MAG TPA: M20/M25/M40 family metallo-hydrolase [Ktedonobacterales bacterium]|jgi:succinyl-diaminopimelate desuccinylase